MTDAGPDNMPADFIDWDDEHRDFLDTGAYPARFPAKSGVAAKWRSHPSIETQHGVPSESDANVCSCLRVTEVIPAVKPHRRSPPLVLPNPS